MFDKNQTQILVLWFSLRSLGSDCKRAESKEPQF